MFSARICNVLGIDCFTGDLLQAGDVVIQRALSGEGGYAVLCNAHVLMTARTEPDLFAALRGAWSAFPDGAPVAWLQRRLGSPRAKRIGGPDLMSTVVDRGRRHGLRHALFGSTPYVVDRLERRLLSRFPGAEIVAAVAPPAGQQDDASLMGGLARTRPHLVWCALGAPKQELWMARSSAFLEPSLVIGVGAAFDFHAGTKKRAPVWMQRSGLEWFHRLASEPRRLLSRYLKTNTAFVVHAADEILRRRIA